MWLFTTDRVICHAARADGACEVKLLDLVLPSVAQGGKDLDQL
jgi:hypothetical protein